jgi:hypothetical protein
MKRSLATPTACALDSVVVHTDINMVNGISKCFAQSVLRISIYSFVGDNNCKAKLSRRKSRDLARVRRRQHTGGRRVPE